MRKTSRRFGIPLVFRDRSGLASVFLGGGRRKRKRKEERRKIRRHERQLESLAHTPRPPGVTQSGVTPSFLFPLSLSSCPFLTKEKDKE
jgi:hypothetical protein